MIIIQSNIIYNFDEIRSLLIQKTKPDSYYLLYDDIYFEKIEKNTVISRDVYNISKNVLQNFNIIKYITFNIKNDYSTKQIYKFVQILRQTTKIILTIFNPKNKEVFILFVSNKDDSKLENEIKNLLEMEQ